MKLKLLTILATIFILSLFSVSKVYAAPDTVLSLQPTVTNPTVNQSFSVYVNIDTGTNEVIGVELYLNFDKSRLRADSISAGSFFTSPETVSPQINNSLGTIAYIVYIPPNATPKSGQGRLAVVNFQAIAEGTASITFSPDTIVGAIKINGQNALKSSERALVTITSSSSSTETSAVGGTTNTFASTPSSTSSSSQGIELPKTAFSLPTWVILGLGISLLIVSLYAI